MYLSSPPSSLHYRILYFSLHMSNHIVPDLELGNVPNHPTAAANIRRKAPAWPEDEIMELIWQNGLVALPLDRPPAAENGGGVGLPAEEAEVAKLFMAEDEMASWLNCQVEDAQVEDGVCLQGERDEADATSARLKKPLTVVESNTSIATEALEGSVVYGSSEKLADVVILDEPRPTSASPSGNAERKRKKVIEDAKFDTGEEQKDPSQCASVRKPRTAESHNLSERRRRDRINTKMKALQELIPKCNKSDKVSTLDEAIEYMKSLQCQLQMMSMGCNANPLMYPGLPAFLPPMRMGMHMGLGMGMGLGMNMGAEMGSGGLGCPMLPFGPIPFPAMAAGYPPVQLGSRPLSPQFHPFPVPTSSQVRGEAINQQDQFSDSIHRLSPNGPQIPHVADPCHQFLNIQHSLAQTQDRALDEAGIRREDGSADDSDSYNG